MKNNLVQTIIDKKLHVVILSPHNDDAVLSCGDLITKLSGKTPITVINFFTKAHKPPYTLSQKKALQNAGFSDAEELYKERQVEDKKAFNSLKVSVINLNFEDALYRRKKQSFLGRFFAEFDHYYPTYRWHVTNKIAHDDKVVSIAQKKLSAYNTKKYLIFAPFGIGNHVDHQITRLVCERVFTSYILYSDFPYNIRLGSFGMPLSGGSEYRLDPDMKDKSDLIRMYKTQFYALFDRGIIPTHQEIYFSNKQL